MSAEQRDTGTAGARYVPLRWVATVLVLYAAFVYLTGLTASPDDSGIAHQCIAVVSLLGAFSAMAVFSVLAQRRHVGSPLLAWPGGRRFILEVLIAAPVAFVWTSCLSKVARLSPELMHMMDSTAVLSRPVIIAPVAYCLLGFTVAPLAEELLYRGVLYRSLRPWMRPVSAVLLQALIFGAMHRYGLAYMGMAFASALLFMGMYLWRRTLWSPILVHALTNGFGLIVLLAVLLPTSSEPIWGVGTVDRDDQPGCRVTFIAAGSPAQGAALKVDDIILAIVGRRK